VSLTILRLLPGLLGLNGSLGNAEVLATRLQWWGIDTEVRDCDSGDALGEQPDIVVIGHGTSSMLAPAADALEGWSGTLREWHEQGTHFFGAGLGGDLLGESVGRDATTPAREGLGLTPVRTILRGVRASLEVSGMDFQGRNIAGYLNDAAIRHPNGADPLMTFLPVAKDGWEGNTGENGEGVRGDQVWVTAISGPFLALNPGIADDILRSVLELHEKSLPAVTAEHDRVDEYAERARTWIRSRLNLR
jgi:CobQ-like glutamine amidotransferase family enzyme